MKKRHHKIYLSFILMISILYSSIGFAQNEMTVHVKFEIENKKVDFANSIQLIITVDGKEIQPLMYVNGFVMPDFKGLAEVDVCFIYKGSRYLFKGLSVSKFETNWVFGIVKSPKEKGIKREYYIRFNPKDGGDGTKVTVTEW